MNDDYVSVEHLVIALLQRGERGAAGRRLQRAGHHPGGVPRRRCLRSEAING